LPAAVLSAAYVYLTHRVRGAYFDSEGVRIHYTDESRGEPLILVHGFAVNGDLNFRRPGVTRALRAGFRVISLDQRGHGLSDKPRDAGSYGATMAADVVRLLDHLNIERAHVVGYSLGGFVALKAATLYGDRFLSLSVCGAGWERPEESSFLDSMAGLEQELRAGRGVTPIAGNMGDGRKQPGPAHTLWVKLMTSVFNDKDALAAMIGDIPDLAVTEDELRSLPMPVCGIVGSDDNLRAGAEALAKTAPNHRLVIVHNADHFKTPMRREFRNALLDFLGQIAC